MGMHKSEELVEVVRILNKEINGLGVEVNGTQIVTDFDNPEGGLNDWFAKEGQDYLEKFHVPYIEHHLTKRSYNAWHNGVDFYTENYSKAEKNKYFRLLYKYSDFRKIPKERQEFVYNSPAYIRAVVVSKNSILVFQRFDLKEFTKEEEGIFKRFGKVFEQAYTRFLDLQKAEEQAREAQIEAALEKVRSSSLAMHNSDQLREIVKVVFEKLKELKFAIDGGAFVGTISKNSDSFNYWIGDDHAEYPGSFKIPKYDARTITDVWNAKKSGVEFISKTYSFKEKNIWFEYAFNNTDLKTALPEDFKKWILEQEYLTQSFAMQKNSMVGVHFHHAKTLTENEIDILKRFSRVFEQSYVRFLDLQKAEAQAREAEIELALERVRARTMAMQSSDELREAVLVINEQLQHLGFESNATNIIIIDKETGNSQYWVSGFTKDIFPVSYQVPKLEHPYYDALLDPWRQGDQYVVYEYTGKGKKSFDKIFFTKTDFKNVHEEAKNAMISLPSVTLSTAFFSYGALQVLGPEAISEDKVIILQRFAKVFNQTYTRFIDLQKAEAQAREAEIELALERVRARTMAMQRSDELPATSFLLFQQLKELGETAAQLSIGIIKEEDGFVDLSATLHGDPLLKTYRVPVDEPFMMKKAVKAWKKKMRTSVVELKGKELMDYNNWRNSFLKADIVFPEKRWVANLAYFSKGMLSFSSEKEISTETFQLLERFAAVFDQTYTRFLDLQKAEAQARESQIEASLERVRSRSMGMQKSEELKEVIKVVYDQFVHLNIHIDHAGFIVDYKPKGDWHFWIADQHEIPSKITHPWFDSVWASQFDEAKEKGINFFATHLNFEEKNKFYQGSFKPYSRLIRGSKRILFQLSGPCRINGIA